MTIRSRTRLSRRTPMARSSRKPWAPRACTWPRTRAASGSRSALFRSRGNTPLVTPHVGPTLAADTSNYTGALSRAAMNQWKNAGYGLVIVQAIAPPPTYPPSVTAQQLDMAGLQRDVTTLGGRPVNRIWFDVEESSGVPASMAARVAFVKEALAVLDA